jgi:hypothetical protein
LRRGYRGDIGVKEQGKKGAEERERGKERESLYIRPAFQGVQQK